MIDRLAELNRVLIAASTLAAPGQSISQAAVLRQCESTVIESTIPDHKLTIHFAETMGLIVTNTDQMMITDIGKDFVTLNPQHTYELTLDQKRMLIRSRYLSGINRLKTLQVLECFTKAYGAQTFQWSEFDSSLPMRGGQQVVEHLLQLGLLKRRESTLEVNDEYVEAVATLLAEGIGRTLESIEEWLAEKREIGDIAEELMLAHEKERVRREGGRVECLCINHVSKLRPDAGYDMESFDGKSQGMAHDRFIEVKGAKSTKVHFYMSDNEIKVATKLKEKYWIYFIGGINPKARTAKNKPIMLQNPIVRILKSSKFKITHKTILVEEI
ncbi:MAG: hypothetical protein UW92_C0001G0006 [Candidatus Jorgensenbacteria bacterium GW2011_GWA2_45_13]|uniref:Protein NO VEIN C-terminal domain-containing protein n=1 Tax=Candidatus Jorgensenbacteria bacterium GW2011_GWA2_45_13 TaxID=1618662 RepID=A0A0G1L952_9BACT|nr:MAG: hypothetical protein UW92_C0001G0006 [Candidatus Jorgensenbacteria bacterium GW2011_GWA2_45_13]